ncbi:MAG: hypothetical protein A2Y07_11900 [Planctomycetes bacterium GWF2_50_10]|nr:MAG: hypothetical protein A2Y07_11900 [Planctomycetes bacterium GWF2_50_10]
MMRYVLRKSGFTLVEAMLAAVILSIAAAGVILPFSSGASLETEGARLTLGASLASQIMDTITAKPLFEPNSDTAGDYDDVLDYDGYSEAEGQIYDPFGTLIQGPEYACLSRSVTCEYIELGFQESQKLPATCGRVIVTVSYKGRTIAQLTRLVSK